MYVDIRIWISRLFLDSGIQIYVYLSLSINTTLNSPIRQTVRKNVCGEQSDYVISSENSGWHLTRYLQ